MDFSSVDFWLYVLFAILVLLAGNSLCARYGVGSKLFQQLFLLVFSLVLLGVVSWESLACFLFVSIYAYVVCVFFQGRTPKVKKIALLLNIPVLLLPLIYYKYAWFIGSLISPSSYDVLKGLIIPVGISFYSFQIASFMIDTMVRGEKVPRILDYMLFCAYFPQIVAGPIERRNDLLPQMQNWKIKFTNENLMSGISLIVLGLFYKLVMADNLSVAFWPRYNGANACIVWINNIIFGLRIYFDFAGYGLTAYGLARCMGVTLRLNFYSPYTATNMTEFWRRWHISLTLWFRDYIYIPLKGNRTRLWWVNILFVFTVSGIWHGAGWNFIIWGALSGAAVVVHRLFSKTGLKLPGIIGWMMTMATMAFIWMFFYSTDVSEFTYYLKLISSWENYHFYINTLQLPEQGMRCMFKPFIVISAIIIIVEYVSMRTSGNPYALFCKPVAVASMLYLLVVLHQGEHQPFIYFSF